MSAVGRPGTGSPRPASEERRASLEAWSERAARRLFDGRRTISVDGEDLALPPFDTLTLGQREALIMIFLDASRDTRQRAAAVKAQQTERES